MSANKITAVVVTWEPNLLGGVVESPLYLPASLDRSNVSEPEWKAIPFTDAIGLPIRYRVSQINFFFATMLINDSATGTVNETLATLSTNFDSTSTDFGEPLLRDTGEVMFRRADGEALSVDQLQKMEKFVKFCVKRAKTSAAARAERGRESDKTDLPGKLMVSIMLSPESFKVFMEANSG
ncbi:hypothetical protein LTR85_009920 [Meristemomyces frigidus]|nr:hypothetical protein LTR85_009920 [Meristemomyces frigidus]